MRRKQILYKNQDYRTLMPLCGDFSSYQGKSIKNISEIDLLSSLGSCDHSKKSGLVFLNNTYSTGPISIDKKIKKYYLLGEQHFWAMRLRPTSR